MKALLILALCACSAKNPDFKSNFASVTFDHGKILKAGAPFTGKLVAKDEEIGAVATSLAIPHVAGAELTGLVVVLPVTAGLVEGVAQVHVDLHADKLNPEVARRSEAEVAFARAKFGSFKVAEATFVHGRIDGAATVWAPTGTAGAAMKVAEATFDGHQLHGPAIEYWSGTTTKKREILFDHDVKAGPSRTFHANGKLDVEVSFVANAPHGEQRAFYASGAPREKRTWDHGKPVGTYERWYPNGQKESVATFDGDAVDEQHWYSNGARTDEPANGVIETFHDNGNLASRTTYAAGTKHGPYATFYDDNAKWRVGSYEHGAEHGRHQRWWRNGTLAMDCTYVAGQLDGAYTRWYGNGTKWEAARYANGVLVGKHEKWWPSGKLAESATYGAHGLAGDYKTFYASGAKWAVGAYVDGKPRGALQRWFPDGKLGFVMNHDAQGRPHGKHETWWANGKPRLVATYAGGRLDGDFKNWLEDGTVYELATFERGIKRQSTRGTLPQ